MGREFHVADSHSLPKNLKGCRVGRFTASRHTHYYNPLRVDPWLSSEPAVAGEGIGIRLGLRNAVLVVASAAHIASREAVDHEGGHSLPGKHASIKVIRLRTNSTARVDDDGGGKPTLNFWPIEHCSYAILTHLTQAKRPARN
jgi:hypothetical protein